MNFKARIKRVERQTKVQPLPAIDMEMLLRGKSFYEHHLNDSPCSLSFKEGWDSLGAAWRETWHAGDALPVNYPTQQISDFYNSIFTVLKEVRFQMIRADVEAGKDISDVDVSDYRIDGDHTPEQVIRSHAWSLEYSEKQQIRAYGERRHTMYTSEYLLARKAVNAWVEEIGGNDEPER